MALAAASPKTMSQQSAALLRLRELLLKGAFTAGTRLAEIPLAKRLQVSRTPLRLALVALEHEGLVQEHPTRGYVVRQILRKDIFETIEIRGMLEGMAARLAVERADREFLGLGNLRRSVNAIEIALKTIDTDTAGAFNTYIEQNQLFHQHLIALAGSQTLAREIDRITGRPFAAPSSGFISAQVDLPRSQHVLRMGHDQHVAIVEALERREAARVETLMREHARLARLNLEIALDENVRTASVPMLRLIRNGEAA